MEHKEFILAQLRRYFDRERMFIVCPPVKEINSRAKAVMDDSALMDDLKFAGGSAEAQVGPNKTIKSFLQDMLPAWRGRESVLVSHKEIVTHFNKENAGMYRQSCVASFMQPLVAAGAVEVHDNQTFRIHVQRTADIVQ